MKNNHYCLKITLQIILKIKIKFKTIRILYNKFNSLKKIKINNKNWILYSKFCRKIIKIAKFKIYQISKMLLIY
jgi:hypothetical protein